MFPERLRSLEPHSAIRVAGTLPSFDRAVAIVGTRRADPEALELAHDLAVDLSNAGCVILSGGALGIDGAAHRGALSTGGISVAVVATGFDVAYPPAHDELFVEIAARGALVTEAEDGTAPLPHLFLRRNALIAALATVTVVVQAPARSGSLSTAAHAKRLGRPVLAVPWAPFDLRGAGCIELLRRGAGVCTSVRDVLSVPALGPGVDPAEGLRKRRKRNEIQGLDDDGRAVVAVLGTRPRHVDDLAARAGVPMPRVQRALLTLLLMGIAEEREGARYVRKRR